MVHRKHSWTIQTQVQEAIFQNSNHTNKRNLHCRKVMVEPGCWLALCVVLSRFSSRSSTRISLPKRNDPNDLLWMTGDQFGARVQPAPSLNTSKESRLRTPRGETHPCSTTHHAHVEIQVHHRHRSKRPCLSLCFTLPHSVSPKQLQLLAAGRKARTLPCSIGTTT